MDIQLKVFKKTEENDIEWYEILKPEKQTSIKTWNYKKLLQQKNFSRKENLPRRQMPTTFNAIVKNQAASECS